MTFDAVPGFDEDDRPPPGRDGRANGRAEVSAEASAGEFRPIDFPSLAGRQPPPRRFIVDQWVPTGCVTSLYGQGGIGKSLLAQQMATCVATGVSAFGLKVEGPAPVVGLFTEDEDDELWRRQTRINDAAGWGMSDLRGLQLQGRAGLENALVTYPSNQDPRVHPLMQVIAGACERHRPGLLVLDNIAQLFGGDENDRFQVSHFCNIVGGLAQRFGYGVLLLGHPSKAEGSEYSGSTAWNNAVRSRLLLGRDKDGELRLVRPKANYAENDALPLTWANGVLRPASGENMGPTEQAAAKNRERHAEGVLLAGLDRLTAIDVCVSQSANATTFAPKLLRQYDLDQGLKPPALRDAMLRLIERGEILTDHPVRKRADRKWTRGLARAPQAGARQEEARPSPDADAPDGDVSGLGKVSPDA